jgi:hypothetical protein
MFNYNTTDLWNEKQHKLEVCKMFVNDKRDPSNLKKALTYLNFMKSRQKKLKQNIVYLKPKD